MIAALTLLLSGLAVCKAARISVLENELNLDRGDQGGAEVANAEVSVEMQNEENEVTEEEVSKAVEMQDDEGTWSQSHCCAKPVSACCTTTPTTRNNGWNNNGNNGWHAPQPSHTCVAGRFAHCNSPHQWTGNQCCLQGHYTCMAGSFIHCNSPSVWTGQQCCMRGHVSNGRGWGLAEVANAEVSVEMQNEENEVTEAEVSKAIEENILDTELSTDLVDNGGMIRVDDGSSQDSETLQVGNEASTDVDVAKVAAAGKSAIMDKVVKISLTGKYWAYPLGAPMSFTFDGTTTVHMKTEDQFDDSPRWHSGVNCEEAIEETEDVITFTNTANVGDCWGDWSRAHRYDPTLRIVKNSDGSLILEYTSLGGRELVKSFPMEKLTKVSVIGKYQAYMQSPELGPLMSFTFDGTSTVHMVGEPGVNCDEAIQGAFDVLGDYWIHFTNTANVGDCWGDQARSYGVDPTLHIAKQNGSLWIMFGNMNDKKFAMMEPILG